MKRMSAMYGVEAAGNGFATFEHWPASTAARLTFCTEIKLISCRMSTDRSRDAYSIAAGLDYPGVGPEHAYFHPTKRVKYVTITDKEAIAAFSFLSRKEGIIPALESAHAIAYVMKMAPKWLKMEKYFDLSFRRGDKDAQTIIETDAL